MSMTDDEVEQFGNRVMTYLWLSGASIVAYQRLSHGPHHWGYWVASAVGILFFHCWHKFLQRSFRERLIERLPLNGAWRIWAMPMTAGDAPSDDAVPINLD